MHFIGQHGLAVRVVLLAAVLPLFVLPRIAELGDLRGRVGAHFRPEGIGIALHEHFARRRRDGVFVNVPFLKAFDIRNPDAVAGAAPFHRIGFNVPLVEIADDAYLLGMGSPDGKAHARSAAENGKMSAEQTVAGVVCSLMVQKRTVFVNCTEFHVSIPPD